MADTGDEGFQQVKWKGRNRQMKSIIPSNSLPVDEIDFESMKVRIWQTRQELKTSDFISKFKETWKEVQTIFESKCITQDCFKANATEAEEIPKEDESHDEDDANFSSSLPPELLRRLQQTSVNDPKKNDVIKSIVCYGLGNFSTSPTSRFQLSFLLLLGNILQIPHKKCYCYDPKFTTSEKALLNDLELSLLLENEEGKRKVSEPTMFYMPHCGKPLYNNLMWANWSSNQLPNVIVLGNSFSSFSERLTEKQLLLEAPYIKHILPFVTETNVTNNFRFNDIFNDLSFHVFPYEHLSNAPSELLEDAKEPNYEHLENVEIIRKEI